MEELATTEIVLDRTALASFIAYLVVVVTIGVYATRFASSGIGEFFVGDRKMNRFVVALSAVVSARSAWLLLGITGMAYQMGASAVWAVTGYIVAELVLFLYYAGRLRRFSEAYDCITIPDFFAARFHDTVGVLRLPLVAIILVFMVSYVSAQFVAGGKAFAASFGLSSTTGLVLTAAIVLIYTVLGGFLAVSLTDVLQGLFMIVALVLLPLVAIADRGGMKAVIDQLAALDPTMIDPLALSAGVLIGFLGIGLGSPGNPHILVRYMSIRDPEQLRYAAVVGTIWNVVMAWGALFIGLVGRVYFPIPELLPGGDAENLFIALARQQLHPVFLGLVVAAVFAAIMSTADSQLLVAASSIVRDLYQKVIRRGREVSPRRLVIYSRGVVVLLVLIALLFGYLAHDLVFWLVLFAWAGLGAAIGPTSILALYWRRTTRAGVLAGLLAATTVTFIWRADDQLNDSLYVLIPGFIAALLATVVVSLITPPPEDVDGMFDKMTGADGGTPRSDQGGD
jgi:sodium/proline symporter